MATSGSVRPMMFGNTSLSMHLLRGVLGIGALLAGVWGLATVGWPALIALPFAIWMLKGCPMCWTQGLFETLAYRAARRSEARSLSAPSPRTADPARG